MIIKRDMYRHFDSLSVQQGAFAVNRATPLLIVILLGLCSLRVANSQGNVKRCHTQTATLATNITCAVASRPQKMKCFFKLRFATLVKCNSVGYTPIA